jgi:hypothetical protein
MEIAQMKVLLSVIVVSALAIPAVSFAQQTNNPSTRAEVRSQLVTAEQQGLLHQSKTQYPKAAPSISAHAATADTSGYGPNIAGSSQAAMTSAGQERALFSHH